MEEKVHLLIMYTMLLLTILLFHKGRKHPQSLLLAIYASVEVLTNGLNSFNIAAGVDFFIRFPFMHFVYKPIYLLWVPLFYFYFRYCNSSDFRLQRKHWVHFSPFFIFFLFFLMIWAVWGNQYILENLYQRNSFLYTISYAVDGMVRIQYLFYNFLMIRSLWNMERKRKHQKESDLRHTTDFKWLRFIVYGYAVGSIGGIITLLSVVMKSQATPVINILSISYFFLFFFAIFYHTITHKISEKEVKPKSKLQPNADMYNLMSRIEELVEGKQMYLNPELSLQRIATMLNEKERNISQVINTIQQRNLNDYLNSLRIEHACRLLLTDEGKPIFEVMYESGFSTKAAFNLAFKKAKGMTPTQWKEEGRNK